MKKRPYKMTKPKAKHSKATSSICEIPLRVRPANETVFLSLLEANFQIYNACLSELVWVEFAKQL